MDQDEPVHLGWQLEKKLSIGHLFTTITIVVSAIWWASSVETRLAVNAQRINGLENADKRADDGNATFRQEIRRDFERVHEKLDRIADARREPSPYKYQGK